jgi:glucuronyl/N-acetylglucosaminyl transferase EXT2
LFEVIQLLSKVHSLSKIIVVWNHMEVSPPPLEEFPRIRQPLIVIRSSVNKLTNRFLSYPEIKTDAILCIDDDITMVTSEEIQFGFEVWWLYPNHLVGFPPRIHVWNNDYLDWSYSSEWYSNFSMVLTGIAFYHKV